MKLRKTQVFTILTLFGALFLGYLLVDSVYVTIKEAERIADDEAKVIAALKKIRDTEDAYLARHRKYASSWDTLAQFLQVDTIYTVEKREIIIPAFEIRSVEMMYKGDSLRVELDTLAADLARNILFPAKAYPDFKPEQVGTHPLFPDTKFELFADTLTKSGIIVHVIEVVDPRPTNPRRKESSENRKRKPLRFGSRVDVSTTGNWED